MVKRRILIITAGHNEPLWEHKCPGGGDDHQWIALSPCIGLFLN